MLTLSQIPYIALVNFSVKSSRKCLNPSLSTPLKMLLFAISLFEWIKIVIFFFINFFFRFLFINKKKKRKDEKKDAKFSNDPIIFQYGDLKNDIIIITGLAYALLYDLYHGLIYIILVKLFALLYIYSDSFETSESVRKDFFFF